MLIFHIFLLCAWRIICPKFLGIPIHQDSKSTKNAKLSEKQRHGDVVPRNDAQYCNDGENFEILLSVRISSCSFSSVSESIFAIFLLIFVDAQNLFVLIAIQLTVDRGIKTLAGSESSVGLGNPTFDQQEGDVNQQSLEMLDKLGYTLW